MVEEENLTCSSFYVIMKVSQKCEKGGKRMNLRDGIQYLNEKLGINFSVLSRQTGIDRTTISRYVSGSRDMSESNKVILSDYINSIVTIER